MSVTHLKFKIDPEKIPPGLLGKFLDMNDMEDWTVSGLHFEPRYYGWIQFHPDGTIEIGEPGE